MSPLEPSSNSVQSFTLEEIERQHLQTLMSRPDSATKQQSDQMNAQARSWPDGMPQDQSTLESSTQAYRQAQDQAAQRSVSGAANEPGLSADFASDDFTSHDLTEHDHPSRSLPLSLSDVLPDGSSTSERPHMPGVFDHTDPPVGLAEDQTSQATLEDPSSLREQVDQAPMISRQISNISNIFDDEPDHGMSDTAIRVDGEGQGYALSPVSSFDDRLLGTQDDAVITTPSAVRSVVQQTPAGLTQMFQSSQDTPILGKRKSEYISMKDSQRERLRSPDQDVSDDEDPEFGKVRSSDVRLSRRTTYAAHSLMQRMRNRSELTNDNPDVLKTSLSRQAGKISMSQDVSTLDADVDMVIPASAEATSVANTFEPHDKSDEIIAESQPAASQSGRDHSVSIVDSLNYDAQALHPASTEGPATGTLQESEADAGTSDHRRNDSARLDAMPIEADGTQSSINGAAMGDGAAQSSTFDRKIGAKRHNTQAMSELDNTDSHRQTDDLVQECSRNSPSIEESASSTILQSEEVDRSRPSTLTSLERSDRSHDEPIQIEKDIPTMSTTKSSRKRPVESSIAGDEDFSVREARQSNLQTPAMPEHKRRKIASEVEDSQMHDTRSGSKIAAPESGNVMATPTQSPKQSSSSLSSLDSGEFQDQASSDQTHKVELVEQYRVLAFRSGARAFRPASMAENPVCLPPSSRVAVAFDDMWLADVLASEIFPLEIHINDRVRIFGQGNKLWSVCSLQKRKPELFLADVHGNTHFEATSHGITDIFPISELIISKQNLSVYQQQKSVKRDLAPDVSSDQSTSLSTRSTSPAEVRRAGQTSGTKSLFGHLAIAITLSSTGDSYRLRMESSIKAHGGHILADGLGSLFEYNKLNENFDIAPRQLTAAAARFHAAFVIADKPCRKVKYLQALALGIPCLHPKYIDHCIQARNILPMQSYLLAAGDANVFGDPVSMSMPCHQLLDGGISQQISARRQVWSGKNVIVVVGNAPSDRRIHIFLSWAMGCADLTECSDLAEACRRCRETKDGKYWDLISVPDQTAGSADLVNRIVTNEDVVQSLITGQFCINGRFRLR